MGLIYKEALVLLTVLFKFLNQMKAIKMNSYARFAKN